MKYNKQRLFEVMGKIDKSFKPRLCEGREHFLDYFKTGWSLSQTVRDMITTNKYLGDKYAQYLAPDFNWDALSDEQLRQIWDDWAVDEKMYNQHRSNYNL